MVFLRGAVDGLNVVIPYTDQNYHAMRPTIAIPRPDSGAANRGIALDNNFAFPQAMSSLDDRQPRKSSNPKCRPSRGAQSASA